MKKKNVKDILKNHDNNRQSTAFAVNVDFNVEGYGMPTIQSKS